MRSPGRRTPRPDERQRFWATIARGLPSEEAAVEAGVAPAVGTRWFRQSGGMPPISMAQLSGRYLAFTEREEIAILHARQFGVREIARGVGRSPSTISRELRRNAAMLCGDLQYRAITAQWHADRRARRPKTAKLARHEPLRQYVKDRLGGMVTTAEPEAGTRSTCSMGRPSPWTSAAPPLGAGVEHLEPPGRHSLQSDSLVTEHCTQSQILGEEIRDLAGAQERSYAAL